LRDARWHRAERKRREKMSVASWEETGTSGPIDADGNGPYRANRASREIIERGRQDCESIEIMQILPRFE
jgi:hypothetical protein